MNYMNKGEHEMNRMKALAAILGVAVLMAVVAACGSAAEPTSLSDVEPTAAPPTVNGTNPDGLNPANYANRVPRWPGRGLCKSGGHSESGGSDY